MPTVDMKGQKFSRLTVIERAPSDKDGNAMWLCICSCGNRLIVLGRSLRRNRTKSCGCWYKEAIGLRVRKHGNCMNYEITSEYSSWMNMKARCSNQDHGSFARYGGRGIMICPRWMKFENFLADMGKKPSSRHSIDRINNDGNYEPSNCRWATRKQQAANMTMIPKRLIALRKNAAIARKFQKPLPRGNDGRFRGAGR
jgi:hypothetical protein